MLNPPMMASLPCIAVFRLSTDVLEEFSNRFPDDLPDLPPERPVFHTIPLQDPNAQPPFQPLRRLSPLEAQLVQKQVTDLLHKGFIHPSSSPYDAPILFVQKKDGTLHMVIDYRALKKSSQSRTGIPCHALMTCWTILRVHKSSIL